MKPLIFKWIGQDFEIFEKVLFHFFLMELSVQPESAGGMLKDSSP